MSCQNFYFLTAHFCTYVCSLKIGAISIRSLIKEENPLYMFIQAYMFIDIFQKIHSTLLFRTTHLLGTESM